MRWGFFGSTDVGCFMRTVILVFLVFIFIFIFYFFLIFFFMLVVFYERIVISGFFFFPRKMFGVVFLVVIVALKCLGNAQCTQNE